MRVSWGSIQFRAKESTEEHLQATRECYGISDMFSGYNLRMKNLSSFDVVYINESVYTENYIYVGLLNVVKHPCLSSITCTEHPSVPYQYCNCCLGTTGYIFPCCYGMCLIESNSRAVSACLSRTVRNPAGLSLPVCLFVQDTESFSEVMQPCGL